MFMNLFKNFWKNINILSEDRPIGLIIKKNMNTIPHSHCGLFSWVIYHIPYDLSEEKCFTGWGCQRPPLNLNFQNSSYFKEGVLR